MGEAAADPFHLVGTTIEGKYRVASVIGDGGFGIVYRGVHKGFGELIAIKCLKVPGRLSVDDREKLLEELRAEGRIYHRLSRLTSGIVQALDVGAVTTDGGAWIPYLVLEWLEGRTLGEAMKERFAKGEGGLSVEEALTLLTPAARALEVAHAEKIAHRDVKPANLFVTTVGGKPTLKLLDFGIAKVLADHGSITQQLAVTADVPSAFTPRYGAPEQFSKHRGATGPWTDVFALALIFVELVTGEHALLGDDPTQLYIASADPTRRPTLRGRGVAVPDEVERVLGKALAVEPKTRYASAGPFWDDLTRAVEGTAPAVGAATARASGRAPNGPLGLAPTLPAESEERDVPRPASLPPVADSTTAPGGRPPRTARSQGATSFDPMAETPTPERRDPRVVRAGDRGAASPRLEDRAGAAAPRPRSRWPWVLGVVGLGAAAAYAVADGTLGARFSGPTASASTSASTAPSNKRPRPPGPPTTPRPPTSGTAAAAPGPSASTATGEDAGVEADAGPAGAPAAPPPGMIRVELDAGDDATAPSAFYLDRAEVRVAEYQRCVTARKCGTAERVVAPGETTEFVEAWTPACNEGRDAPLHPINCVDAAGAEAYCRFVGKRLPTDAEWSAAAGRGPFVWGDRTPDCSDACFDRNGTCFRSGTPVTTCAVGAEKSDVTPSGIVGLGGNVAEWVATAPPGQPGRRYVRGGGFLDAAAEIGVAQRRAYPGESALATVGFRCALNP